MNSLKPNFFIVGAAKSGTTSIYHYLRQHPEIYMSPIKEPNYFCTDITNALLASNKILHNAYSHPKNISKYIKGDMTELLHKAFITKKSDYYSLFNSVKYEKAIGEASVSYLQSNIAAKNISSEIPNSKIIIILRNPADRAYSHYLGKLKRGRTKLSFDEEILDNLESLDNGNIPSILKCGLYYDQVMRYFEFFPESQILILLYDDLLKTPNILLNQILIFLKVEKDFIFNTAKTHNIRQVPKYHNFNYLISKLKIRNKFSRLIPYQLKNIIINTFNKSYDYSLSEEHRKRITRFYLEDITKLSKMTNINLDNWK